MKQRGAVAKLGLLPPKHLNPRALDWAENSLVRARIGARLRLRADYVAAVMRDILIMIVIRGAVARNRQLKRHVFLGFGHIAHFERWIVQPAALVARIEALHIIADNDAIFDALLDVFHRPPFHRLRLARRAKTELDDGLTEARLLQMRAHAGDSPKPRSGV